MYKQNKDSIRTNQLRKITPFLNYKQNQKYAQLQTCICIKNINITTKQLTHYHISSTNMKVRTNQLTNATFSKLTSNLVLINRHTQKVSFLSEKGLELNTGMLTFF